MNAIIDAPTIMNLDVLYRSFSGEIGMEWTHSLVSIGGVKVAPPKP